MMTANRMTGTCAMVLLLSAASHSAGRSEVADAVIRKDKASVRTLLAQHADVNAPQADCATALHWAAYRGGATPLWLATVNGDAAIIAALITAGADPNEHLPLGRTPLMTASRTGNVEAMKVLLDHGADVNAKETLRGTTALMWAADEAHPAAVQLLIQRGADIKARSNPASRGRGPALGKANDPRKAVAAQGAAVAAGRGLDLNALKALPEGGRGRRGAARGQS